MTEIRATDYFAIVPEWILHAEISSNAVRLYAILHRFANSRGVAWPSRKTIAEAMRCSTATVDRAKEELVEIGALTVHNRTTDAGDPTSNLYVLHIRPVETVEGSSPVPKGISTGEERGIRTGDALTKASTNQTHLGTSTPMTSPSTWCPTCHNKKVVMAPAWYDETRGWIAATPKPCPECVL